MYKIPNFLKPKCTSELIRIGSSNDGGYVVSKNAVIETDTLISFGLFDDWKFEKEFKSLSNCKVLCYDNTVTPKFWIIRLLKNIYSILKLKKITENFVKLPTYFQYLNFFNNKDIIHFKKYIAPVNEFTFGVDKRHKTDLNEILLKNFSKNVFLKIDIEGSEYRILNQVIQHQEKLNGIVIEFHNCDLHFDRIKQFIDNLNLDLIHIHVNNYSNVNHLLNPDVIELTFCNKRFSLKTDIENIKFPIKNLDSPNNKDANDPQVIFY